ncbi:hypothetical protein BC781_101661 [Sediminitomix flava]|uniref:Uncharacterized protein n=1 Tax=Sediminitomix flava TaxID=379075 RepID=A0A315ZFN0_SEDFL|nr:hypothetical protein BC781_101661 [Sediminitomix flava]
MKGSFNYCTMDKKKSFSIEINVDTDEKVEALKELLSGVETVDIKSEKK